MLKVYGKGNESEPDPSHLLPKADQAALHPGAATLLISLHNGYTVRMVRLMLGRSPSSGVSRSQGSCHPACTCDV